MSGNGGFRNIPSLTQANVCTLRLGIPLQINGPFLLPVDSRRFVRPSNLSDLTFMDRVSEKGIRQNPVSPD